MRVTVSPRTPSAEPGVALKLGRHAPVFVPWSEAVREVEAAVAAAGRGRGDGAALAVTALGEAARRIGGQPPSFDVTVDSDIPAGHGMGSSAALALAILDAVCRAAGRGLDREALEAAAHVVERRQHGAPSGVDVATVLRGGVICASAHEPTGQAGRADAPRLRFHALDASSASLSRLRVFDSGCPANGTGEVVRAVRRRLDADPGLESELERMGRLAAGFADLLVAGDDPAAEAKAIREFQAALESLGVVPPSAARLIRRIEAEGGAAKVSGAGGLCDGEDGRPGAGMILVHHEDPERVLRWPFLGGLEPVDALVGGPGLEAW